MGATTPTAKTTAEQAQEVGAAGVRAVFGGKSDKAAPADTAEPAAEETSATGIGGFFEGIWNSIKKFVGSIKENGSIGSIIGGIIGLGGAWFAGNFFGGGIMSTILMVALAIPFMLVGSDSIGGWINGMLGGSKTPAAGAGPSQAQGAGASQAKTREDGSAVGDSKTAEAAAPARPAPVGPATALTNEELNAIIGASNNLKDRVRLEPPNTSNGKVQVLSVPDNVTKGEYKNIVDAQALRDGAAAYEAQMAAREGRAAQPITGITLTPMSNGKIRIVGTTVGSLPTQSGQLGR